MGACKVCDLLDKDQLLQVATLKQNGCSYEQAACDLHVPYEDMEYHFNGCLGDPKSRFEHLTDLVNGISENMKIAEDVYQQNSDQADLAKAYTAMTKELRQTIVAAQNLVKPEDQVRELTEMVLAPMVRAMVFSLTDEVSKLRDELIAQGTPKDRADIATKARLTALGTHMKRSLREAMINLNKYYGVTAQQAVDVASPVLKQTEAKTTIH